MALPPRPVTRLTAPLVRFMHLEAAGGLVLLAATLLALGLANSGWGDEVAALWNRTLTIGVDGASLSYPLWYWVNDGLMAIFFFVIGLEIKRELVWGELRDRRNIVLPAIAAVAGAAVPVGLYLLLQPDLPGRAGWAVPMATDIAFVVGCLAVLGSRVPPALKIFVLSLAIIDDLLAVVIIALVFTGSLDLGFLAGAGVGLVAIVGLQRLGVRSVGAYVLVGAVVWLCTLKAGIHPTVAGVVLGLMTPAQPLLTRTRLRAGVEQALATLRRNAADGETAAPAVEGEDPDGGDAADRETAQALALTATEAVSPLERLEHALHPWVAFAIMPIFALVNAGVILSASALADPIAVAVTVGLAVGKPVGIAGGVALAVALGVGRLPEGTSWMALIGAAWLCGIGFTMAIFIASLSIDPGSLAAAKAGILAGSALSLVGGMALLVVGLRRRPATT
ncbi:MAG: Na+/H+ antiporter NhaA [Kofleriaceae bacterium]